MGLLDHKTAVITGANSGIGLATAVRFIAEGADRVFVTGRRQPELSAAATQLGSRAVAVPGDVGTPEDLDRLYTKVDAAGKGLDHPDRVHHRRPRSSGTERLRRIQGRRALVGARLG
jgi:NAD(P)-dependent dehydrogenase (short-subunit alcohol dehydrogenase family)